MYCKRQLRASHSALEKEAAWSLSLDPGERQQGVCQSLESKRCAVISETPCSSNEGEERV